MKNKINVAIFLFVLLFCSCKTAYLPLCEQFAKTKPSPLNFVGIDCYESCKKKHIKIFVLNSNVALFKGSKKNIEWLKKNYVFLFCSFNQNDPSVSMDNCNVCINNVQKWIKLINDNNLNKDSLATFFQDKNYCNVCVPRSPCTH